MRHLLTPEDFFDGDLSVHGTWVSQITGERHDIPVIWVNDPFDARPQFEGARPMIEIHDTFAADMQQDDDVWIEGTRYRVRMIAPFDSEGFTEAELMNADPY